MDGFTTRVQGTWGQPDPIGNMINSPYQYHLLWPQRGSFITGFSRNVVQRDLATVHRDVAASASGVWGQTTSYGYVRGSGGSSWALGYLYNASASHVVYYNAEPGLEWTSRFVEQVPMPPFWRELSVTYGPYVAYQRGRTYRETWNRGVFGPVFPQRAVPENWLTRTGDKLVVNTPAYGDGAGRAGTSVTDTASVTVHKDGVEVGTVAEIAGQFTVPPEPGRYRVVQEGNRSAPFTLSTKVNTTWTFRSGHVGGTVPVALPVSVIRFSPTLDAQNKAPSGRLFGVPVRVQRQPGSAAARTRSFHLAVSYDDGQTWTQAFVLGHGDNWVALLHHPAGGGFVSLRAKATDVADNTVEQTIIRAYRF